MRLVELRGTGLNVSRLSFGTASLHHLSTSKRRDNLLAAAVDHGFTHFDTAPYYGFGIAERALGRFLTGRGDRVTVATKVGLYPPSGSDQKPAAVWTRKLAGKLFPVFSRPIVNWSLAAAAKSLDSSLRRLRIDRIDLLLLHEPTPYALQSEAFLEWLKTEKRKGRIRYWGLAGDAIGMDSWLSTNHELGMVLQVRDSLDRREADLVTRHGRDLQITYGYLSSAGSVSKAEISETLQRALKRNRKGSVLVSTRNLTHLSELASVAEAEK